MPVSKKDDYGDLVIRKFEMSQLSHDKIVVCLGRRGSGKSYLIKDILYNFRKIPYGIVCSGTEHVSPFYTNHMPSGFIHSDVDIDMLDDIFGHQDQRLVNCQKPFSVNQAMLLIFDDVAHSAKKWSKDPRFAELFLNGRHRNIMFIMALQSPLMIECHLREQIDAVFIFYIPQETVRKKVWENYASVIPNLKLFTRLMNHICKDNTCMVILSKAATKWQDSVFYYKSPETPNFKFGCHSYWDLGRQIESASSSNRMPPAPIRSPNRANVITLE